MSYIPNLTALPLHEILLDNGYVINKNKHSKNNPCLKHEDEEGSLVIFKNQNKDGSISYTYKETHTDKVGNIITFCKDRNLLLELVFHFLLCCFVRLFVLVVLLRLSTHF